MARSLLFDARPLTDANSGGVRRVAKAVLESILASDPEIAVTCVTTGWKKIKLPDPFREHPCVTHVHLRIPNKIWSLLAMLRMTSLDKAFGVWRLAFGGAFLPNAKCQMPIASLLPNIGFTGPIKTPYALILHDLSFLIEPRWFPLKTRLWHIAVNPKEMARRADTVFCVSETTARDAERLLGIPREKIRVFAPGIPTLPSQTTLPRPLPWQGGEVPHIHDPEASLGADSTTPRLHGFPYVLTFDEDDPRKNAATSISAVEILRREETFGDLKLVIVESKRAYGLRLTADGRTNPAVSRKPLAVSQTNDHLIRVSRPSDAELADLYANASALLYPSWYEGFGLPLHEAARYGTPCIASTWGALPETAPQGTIFAPPAKPHLWASTLRDILISPERHRTTFDESATKTDVSTIIEWMRRVER